MNKWIVIPVLAACAAGASAQERIYAVTETNQLVSFMSNTPGTLSSNVMISGMTAGAKMVGIDLRPNGGALYGIGSDNKIYTIHRVTGVATAVGSGFTSSLTGTSFGVDFNPTVDRIRVTSDADQNLRLNPITGGTAFVDAGLAYNVGDPNFGMNPSVVGSAYINNRNGATTTTLYNIDSATDSLLIQNPPNAGGLVTVGAMGVDTNEWVGFDISGATGVAFVSLTTPGSGVTSSNLFRMNLATGSPSFIGTIGSGDCSRITSLTVVPEPGTMAALGLGAAALLRRRRKA